MTSSLSLRIYSFSAKQHSFYGSTAQNSFREVSLLSNSQLRSSIYIWMSISPIVDNIIAIAADRIEIGNHLLGIVVIMSNNGIISCYDESLRLLWKISVYESNLINMSTLIVSNSALTISKQRTCGVPSVIYVSISYSISPKHFIKARFPCFSFFTNSFGAINKRRIKCVERTQDFAWKRYWSSAISRSSSVLHLREVQIDFWQHQFHQWHQNSIVERRKRRFCLAK